MRTLILLIVLALPLSAQATTYYISPVGNDSFDGLTTSTPWLTFAFAVSQLSCGDTLLLRDGTYGDGTPTGKLVVNTKVCTLGNEMTFRAENQRQAEMADHGAGIGAYINASSYIVLDGLYVHSQDSSTDTDPGDGTPVKILSSTNITVRNMVIANPNRYANSHGFDMQFSVRVLFEDNEIYTFHRHGILMWQSAEITSRRTYCNPRGGRISGGFGAANGVGSADACVSMYPCRDCIVENTIADGTTNAMYLTEMNATYGSTILMSGSKVLGSICYKCNYGNGIYLASRLGTGLNRTPQNITIKDVALIDWGSTANGIRVSDGVGIVLDHISIFGTETGSNGVFTDDPATTGVAAAQNSITMTNLLVTGFTLGAGLRITGFNTWSGDEIFSTGNLTAFSPTPPSNWTNTSTAAHGMGNCRLWVPATSAMKGAGTGGSDIGATILYRYVDGTLTTTALWDPTSGEFPHGAADPDGINRVAGQSLFDFHSRVNVNTGGCSFPDEVEEPTPPADPATYQSGSGTTGATWSHTIDGGTQGLLVGVALYHTGGSVGTVTGVTGCSSENIPMLSGGTTVTSPAYRRVYVFGKTSPTSGSCTITVSTTGNVSFTVGTSVEIPTMGSFGTVAVATGLSSAPSVTVTTNTGETVIDFVGGKCLPSSGACTTTLTAGTDQTLQKDAAHASGDLRLASSTQSGDNGGVMSHTMGGSNYWASVGVPIISSSPDPPSTATLTQTKYRIYTGYGEEATVTAKAAANTAATTGPQGLVRIRVEIQGGVANTTPFGVALYCDRNSGGYAKVMDTYGSNAFRMSGPGPSPLANPIPPSLTSLTQKLSSGSFVAGAFLRDSSATYVVPELTAGQRVEVEWAIQLNASVNDTISCRARKDDGTVLDTYTNTPAITIRKNAANRGF